MATSTPTDLVSEFKCTSSVIFLTHPIIKDDLSKVGSSSSSKSLGISIKEIYYKKDGKMELIWSINNDENVINNEKKEMKTLQVVLNSPQQIINIKNFAEIYPSSISDIDGVIKGQEISKGDDVSKLANVLPELTKDSVASAEAGDKFRIPDNFKKEIKMIPDNEDIKKPKVPIFGKYFTLSKENGVNIAVLE